MGNQSSLATSPWPVRHGRGRDHVCMWYWPNAFHYHLFLPNFVTYIQSSGDLDVYLLSNNGPKKKICENSRQSPDPQ